MSSYVCSAKTIAVIAENLVATFNAGVPEGEGIAPADFAVNMLKLNLRSVGWHYHMTPARTCKEFTGKTLKAYTAEVRKTTEDIVVAEVEEGIGPGRILGAVSCFLYQASDLRDAEKNVTFKTVERYEKVLIALCEQQGLQEEGWDF